MKHYIIPVFIPEMACPNRCIYCDQYRISGQKNMPDPDDFDQIIQAYLSTIPKENHHIEVGFFGGNFTGIPRSIQERYLGKAYAWLAKGHLHGIRLSTRPDYVNSETIKLLKQFEVGCVELGVQSFDPEVLRLSKRGHTTEDILSAASMIRNAGISLGMQMMIGLPGDNFMKTMDTAEKIVEAGADNTRIYPTLVIRGTILEDMYQAGLFRPLEMDEAVAWCARLLQFFEEHGVRVLRLGLHPSKELLNGEGLVAGPFHAAFGELVMTRVWRELLAPLCLLPPQKCMRIQVAKRQINSAIGHQASNRLMLEERHKRVVFGVNEHLEGRRYHVDDH